MTPIRTPVILASVMAVLACSTCATPVTSTAADVSPLSESWHLDAARTDLVAQSCPGSVAFETPGDIDIRAEAIPLGSPEAVAAALPANIGFAGGWSLTSSNSNLGGLSGLAILENGDLLSVSDAGALVWISMMDGHPADTGKIAYLRDENGDFLTGKTEADAEGLVYEDGLALISFERTHRIEAFAIGTCGAAARAARVASLPAEVNGWPIDENRGAEALAIQTDGSIHFGYEGLTKGASPLGRVSADGRGTFAGDTAGNPSGYALVGQDIVASRSDPAITLTLFRSYDPLRGNRNVVRFGNEGPEIEIKRPLTSDNFEGIAGQILENGRLRVWIVSDDNFSERQRTLLFAFDMDPSTD